LNVEGWPRRGQYLIDAGSASAEHKVVCLGAHSAIVLVLVEYEVENGGYIVSNSLSTEKERYH
jgi:hypothetical protein